MIALRDTIAIVFIDISIILKNYSTAHVKYTCVPQALVSANVGCTIHIDKKQVPVLFSLFDLRNLNSFSTLKIANPWYKCMNNVSIYMDSQPSYR